MPLGPHIESAASVRRQKEWGEAWARALIVVSG